MYCRISVSCFYDEVSAVSIQDQGQNSTTTTTKWSLVQLVVHAVFQLLLVYYLQYCVDFKATTAVNFFFVFNVRVTVFLK